MELIFAQSWSKWNLYWLKIEGKTRKILVTVWDKRWSKSVKVMKWFAINCNSFKAFVMFALKNWKSCLFWSENVEYSYVSPEIFF
jgi:hypothetical protein